MAGYGTSIEIGGKRRTLRYDLNALAEIEEKTGRPISQVSELNVDMRTVRAIVWAGFIHAEPDLTLQEVGSWIGPGGMSFIDALKYFHEAFGEAFGDANPTQATDLPEPAIGVGRTSSASALVG
jgi:hypothetical protein